jgi:hypothetical protein
MNYALVDNGYVKIGPRPYSSGIFFQDYLDRIGVDYTIPDIHESSDQIIVSNTIFVSQILDPVIPSFNEPTQQLAGPFWDTTKNPITGYYTVVNVPIDIAKNKLKDFLAVKRYIKETSPAQVTIQNKSVEVGAGRGDDRNLWINLINSTPTGTTKNYKFSNGVWLALSKADMQNISSAISSKVQLAFDWELNYTAQIDAATTLAQIQALKTSINSEA